MRYRSYGNGGNFFGIGILIFFMFGGFQTLFLLLPLLSFLPLLIFGFVIFKLISKINKNSQFKQFTGKSSLQRNRFVELLMHFIALTVKADGKIDSREKQTVISFFAQNFKYQNIQIQWISDLYDHALRQSHSIDLLCTEFNQHYKFEEKVLLIELLLHISMSDNDFAQQEQVLLEKIVSLLNIPKHIYDAILTKYDTVSMNSSNEKDYEILGVSSTASKEEIKKAYKDLIKKFHPDKVQHLGDEFKNFAEDKIKKINKAYEKVSAR